jgi:hypothetical protein
VIGIVRHTKIKVNPYDPPTSEVVTDVRSSTKMPAQIRFLALCAVLLGLTFISSVVLFGDSHKRALDFAGAVLLTVEFLLVARCLWVLRTLKK